MLSAATSHSALRPRRYSTRKAVMGDPPLALGIQVTYTELSVAMEMVGRSGASGTGQRERLEPFSRDKQTGKADDRHHCARDRMELKKVNAVELCVLTAGALKLESAGESKRERKKRVSGESSVSFSTVGLFVARVQHANTHADKQPHVLQHSSYKRVITGCLVFSVNCGFTVCALEQTTSKHQHHITHSLVVNSTEPPHKTGDIQRPASAQISSGKQKQRGASELTSVVYDHAKVRVGSFVLWSFGRRRDDGRLGRVLVGGGALLCDGKEKEQKAGVRKQDPTGLWGYRAPQEAHGTAPDVGSGILSFLLVSGSVQVLSGWVSSFRPTTLHLRFDCRCLAECAVNVFLQ